MRIDADWVDVSIRNLSSRGLMARTNADVTLRSYVELRRGNQIVIGRVVWSHAGFFGLRSQDMIDVNDWMGAASGREILQRGATATQPRSRFELKTSRDLVERAAASRTLGNRFQFIAIGTAGLSGCATIAMMVADILETAFAPALAAFGG